MKTKFIKIFFLFVTFLMLPNLAFATPSIVDVSGSLNDGQNVSISGSGFGAKTIAAPVYWDNFESYALGSAPTAGGWIVRAGTPTISSERPYSFSKSVRFNNAVHDVFQQMSRDMGTNFTQTVYFKGKLYLDNTLDICQQYQWKNLRFSSSPGAYHQNEETSTSITMMNPWWEAAVGSRWFNTGSPDFYYNGGLNGIPGGTPLWGGINAPSTLYPFNQWFDYEFIVKQSSAAGIADGALTINVNGTQKTNATGLITYGVGDGIYRYMMMGGTIASCKDSTATVLLDPNFKIYYDDMYVDDTRARVEVCNANTKAGSTHCEIQVPQNTWSDGQLEIKLNQGTFANDSSAYLYVADANGSVNAVGFPVTFGATSGDIIAPAAPTDFGVL
ncbi:MAG: hypothetical protein HGA36_02845 [Candidatus Moranbacteria bacterium]|nr:hypothetical protein [Candidatus Moranbacteria bacterium]